MNALTTNWALVRSSLAAEKAREIARLRIDDTSFLPAALEVIERPVSPTGRWTARILIAGVGVLALGLALGQTDIVASAPGRIVPTAAVQLVQPAQAGIVRRILVHDGDRVAKGQALVQLDPTATGAERTQAENAYQTIAFDVARTKAVIDSLQGRGFNFVPPAGADPLLIQSNAALARARLADIEASIAAQHTGGAVARADIATARVEAAKLTETLPLLDQQLEANEKLLEKGFVSRLRVLEMRRQRIAQARDRDAAFQAVRRASAQAVGASRDSTKIRADALATLLDEYVKSSAELKLRETELIKTRQRASLQILRAPVAGIVGQLSVHTEGGVVEAAKPIMTIVPADGRMVAEARVLNRDIGFISVGQKVAMKLDAFPFSRHGTIPGHIVRISPDAVDDEKLGPVFLVRVALDRNTVSGNVRAGLSPGMTGTADIVTGRRTFLSYLTSPIEEAGGSALRER